PRFLALWASYLLVMAVTPSVVKRAKERHSPLIGCLNRDTSVANTKGKKSVAVTVRQVPARKKLSLALE
ncbi:MAG: hypothetical protein ACYTXY_45950, partial [Nostoc sp.]